MGVESTSKLNHLQRSLPEGFPVTAAWLKEKGFSNQLVNKYRASGWLEPLGRGVWRRPGPQLRWQHVVASLGTLDLVFPPPHVGGLSALELRGYAHYLKPSGPTTVHLYSEGPLPRWL